MKCKQAEQHTHSADSREENGGAIWREERWLAFTLGLHDAT